MTQRFLIVQLADIGNLVLATPAIAALREKYPDSIITLAAFAHAIPVLPESLVDNIVTFDQWDFNFSLSMFLPANLRRIRALRKERYDAIVFFHHFTLKLGTLKFAMLALGTGAKRRIGLSNHNSWFLDNDSNPSDLGFGARHQAQYWLDLVATLGADPSSRPVQVQTETFQTDDFDSEIRTKRPRIVIHAGSGGYSQARRWSPDKFVQVADQLRHEYDAEIVLVGSSNDDAETVYSHMQFEPINLTGKTTLPQLAGVIRSADLFLGTDSGVMHVASATGTPVVAIFGPSNYRAWHPWTPAGQATVIVSGAECSPCSYVEHGIGLRHGCDARTCMKMITVNRVLRAAKRVLDSESGQKNRRPVIRQTATSVIEQTENTRIQILGLPVDAITYEQWLTRIGKWVADGNRCYHVCTVNPEFLMIAQKDVNFQNILKRSDINIPDGVGLLWAAKHVKTPLPERVTGSDGVPIIAERAAKESWKLFFLGAAPGIAQQAAVILQEKYPGLQVVGTYPGSPAPEEEAAIVRRINASGADILFVAYGAPIQDKWIARNMPRLKVKMAMGVGGSFDFIVGIVPRAPLWMQNAGIEWLYRLIRQPWRWKRMLRLPRFVFAVLWRGAG